MIYDIRLTIACNYPAAVADARHLLCVRPRGDCGQHVLSSHVDVSPHPDEQHGERDFFGNFVEDVTVRRPHRDLDVEMRARVRVDRAPADLVATPTLVEIADAAITWREAHGLSPIHFLGRSRRIVPVPAVTTYAEEPLSAVPEAGTAVLDLARRIHADFAYEPGATDVRTGVAEAFARRRGVCQDFAHVMVAGLRGVGIPAAYVSGFLRTDPPPGKPRLEGADSMHAWAAAWLGPEVGWIGFDPTNGVVAGRDHIIVAMGRDYADVAPVAGVVVTAGHQRTSHAVDVVPLDDDTGSAGSA
ncbi:transglutaminase family protein [Aurantimonas sp. A2-1-M11]|uniref:transglutaminase family protein n=1 Tax=Aurantimonas sp. A2-1-M11 TaxID=3113712 RepID=UPI002F948C99